MPMYYSQLRLSNKEKAIYFVGVVSIGMSIGMLFYDSALVGAALCVIIGCLGLSSYKEGKKAKRRAELLLQFRDLLYSISASVSSGRSMRTALEEAREFCSATYEKEDYIMKELEYMQHKLENGNETATSVLWDFAKRSGIDDIEDFAQVYESCKTSGGDLKSAIGRATSLIGDKLELEGELKGLLAQKLFEGRIVGIAPFAVVFMIKLTAPEYMEVMTATRQGFFITSFSLLLTGVAVWMTERIHKIEI